MSLTPSKYRKDIQVLRGFAVLAVVLFHAKEDLFSLGYLGVDVFFVISGFVVTPLILRIFDEKGTLGGVLSNLLKFYKRRFFRLAPALGATLAISALCIFLVGNLGDHLRFARQGIATLLLLGNLGAFKYSGNYFSPNPNPLVHTWSLSVEEQIYFILPILILLIIQNRRPAGRKIFSLLLLILTISCFLFVVPQILDPLYTRVGIQNALEFGFYSPLSRVWQFCLGGVVYFVNQKRRDHPKTIVRPGHAALVAPLILLVTPLVHLEIRVGSLIASAIAASVILYRSLDILPVRISGLLEWLGDRSYSIYLVHMPLIYIAKYSPLSILVSNRNLGTLIAVVFSVVFGSLSYSKIEEKYRSKSTLVQSKTHQVRRVVVVFLVIPGLLLFLVDGAARQNYESIFGKNWAHATKDLHQVFLRGCVDQGFDPVKCLWKSPGSRGTVMLVGDSQAYADADGVIEAAKSLNLNVIASSASGCPFLDVDTSGAKPMNCRDWQRQVFKFIGISKPDVVVIANRTNGYLHPESGWRTFLNSDGAASTSRSEALVIYQESLKRTLKQIVKSGSRAVIFQNIPEPSIFGGQSILSIALKQQEPSSLPLDTISIDEVVQNMEKVISQANPFVQLIDPQTVLCTSEVCTMREKGQNIYWDNWHLSVFGSKKLSPLIKETLRSSLK